MRYLFSGSMEKEHWSSISAGVCLKASSFSMPDTNCFVDIQGQFCGPKQTSVGFAFLVMFTGNYYFVNTGNIPAVYWGNEKYNMAGIHCSIWWGFQQSLLMEIGMNESNKPFKPLNKFFSIKKRQLINSRRLVLQGCFLNSLWSPGCWLLCRR